MQSLKEKLACGFKYDMSNFILMGHFYPKYVRLELKKIQRSYLSWHWAVMQNLENPDLVVSKKAWGIGRTFIIRALKSLRIVHGWALFVQSIYCFSQKLPEKLCVMTLKGVPKFKRKLTCWLKNDRRSLVNFYASSWNSKNWYFDWIRLSKIDKYLDYVSWNWRVTQSLKKNWLVVPKMTWGIWWILMRVVGSMEICTLMCCFCQ